MNIGSSPHTWRTPEALRCKQYMLRIISTYVENTYSFISKLHIVEDHLHIRGEHGVIDLENKTESGSSPHTWRTLTAWTQKGRRLRIISTYVENTQLPPAHWAIVEDHLHIRGEHSSMKLSSTPFLGSSPHTWRTQFNWSKIGQLLRIISTYVENTSILRGYPRMNEDHLHIRGEHIGALELV